MSLRISDIAVDPLSALQLQVAQRADVIASGQPKVPGLDLHCWLTAEREVFGENLGETAIAAKRARQVHSPQG